MAALLPTRHWESDDSLNSFGDISSKQCPKSQENPQKENLTSKSPQNQTSPSKQALKRKPLNATPKTANWKLSTDYRDIVLESSNVKASALLYEITERTNQLAQPRVREAEIKGLQPRATTSQIPKASPRILELSRPRIIYQRPFKPVGYVSPGALTAVATQRIIELSRPKKKRRSKVPKRRRVGRLAHKTGNSKVCKGKSWKHMGQKTKKVLNLDYGLFPQSKNDYRIKKKKTTKRKQYSPRPSNSNRTIIMVDISPRNSSKAKPKRARHA